MSDDSHFSRVRKNLQIGEDFKLAYELQEREFGHHYKNNRETNGRLVSDFKKSLEEQKHFAEPSNSGANSSREEEDLKLALKIQENLDREELLKIEQMKEDQRLAWNLATNFGLAQNNPFLHDVQEFYERRK
ncbi:unnamed protein product [Caenorhabditis angaria]|uniref:Coiled-coil domain-containing protein n=1 Tax=Caenorhabditis angaria TaxID=860376 RepID=A0A9P1IEQ2_9PELO|nr:unnamed protein product [Caenorhabditis angaria]